MATFYNRATMTYNNITTTSNVAQSNLVAAISASKTAVVGTYNQDDSITYVVSINNSSSVAFTGLTITDDLGAYAFDTASLVPLTYVTGSVRYYLNGVLQSAPMVNPGPPLSITGLTVPANGNATIIYAARTNNYAPLGDEASIVNTARITGSGINEPVVVSATVTPVSGVQLSISKSISPSNVTEGEPVTYTITIQNYGSTPATVADNVIITDVFDPILSITSVRFNGVQWFTPANYTYNAATGLFSTVNGQITVPAATYTQDSVTGAWTLTPGTAVLEIVGTL